MNNSIVEKMSITPVTALDILNTSNYGKQRPIRKSQVDLLSREMLAGNFLTNTLIFCIERNGKKHLVNGQHTMHAIVQSGVSLVLPVETFFVSSGEEIASIYSRIDKQKKRTRMDTMRVYNLEEKFGMPQTALERYAASCAMIISNFEMSGGERVTPPDEEIIDKMACLLPYAKAYMTTLESSPLASVMMRRDVLSIGIITVRDCPAAPEFWRQVALDDGLKLGDPRKTLNRWLNDSAVSGGQVSGKKRIVDFRTSVRAVALSWNAWRSNDILKIIRITKPSAPFLLKDTTFKKS